MENVITFFSAERCKTPMSTKTQLSDVLQTQKTDACVEVRPCSLWVPKSKLLHFTLPEKESEQPGNAPVSTKHDGICTYHELYCKHIPYLVLFGLVHLPLCCNSV